MKDRMRGFFDLTKYQDEAMLKALQYALMGKDYKAYSDKMRYWHLTMVHPKTYGMLQKCVWNEIDEIFGF